MIFLLVRHQQARSAILRSSVEKSSGFVNLFSNKSKSYLKLKTLIRILILKQLIDLSEVLFNITADGCAFYSISHRTQALFIKILSRRSFFNQIHLY